MTEITQTPVSTEKPESLDALTGLRFVAALAVVLVHAVSHSHQAQKPFWNYFANNAVTFFFVLSGFILTYVYWERLGQMGIWRFFLARFARIWPLHIVCMLAMLVIQHLLLGTYEESFLVSLHALMIHSWVPFENWFIQINGPSWSISTEFGFYLLFPLILGFGRKRLGMIAILFLGFTITLIGLLQYASNVGWINGSQAFFTAYPNPLVRVFEFVIGMWVGSIFLKQKTATTSPKIGTRRVVSDTIAEVAAIVFLGLLFYVSNYIVAKDHGTTLEWSLVRRWIGFSGGVVWGYAVLIWVFAWSRGLVGRLMSTATAVYLGEISFSLYLVQIPVMRTLEFYVRDANVPLFYYVAISIAICLGFSILLYSLVELPFRTILISLFSRQWDKIWPAILGAAKMLRQGYAGGIALALIVVPCLFIQYDVTNQSRYTPVASVIEQLGDAGAGDYFPIAFEGEAILYWWNLEETEQKIELTMLWEILPEFSRKRFVHLCDRNGKILAHGRFNPSAFRNVRPGDLVIDRCTIDKKNLKRGTRYFGVGFFRKGVGAAKVLNGFRQMDGRRLIVGELRRQKYVRIPAKRHRAQNDN